MFVLVCLLVFVFGINTCVCLCMLTVLGWFDCSLVLLIRLSVIWFCLIIWLVG